MKFHRYQATVTYLSSVLALHRVAKLVVEIHSQQPFEASDPALLNALRGLPANSTITGVELQELPAAA